MESHQYFFNKTKKNRRQKESKIYIIKFKNLKIKKKINDNYDFVVNAAGYNKITSLN